MRRAELAAVLLLVAASAAIALPAQLQDRLSHLPATLQRQLVARDALWTALAPAARESLRRRINELRDGGVSDIVIDASRISFIDSVGLSIMIALRLRLAESGASLALRSPSTAVRRMLEIAGLDHELLVDD